ncbi:hypothetical protein SAMN04488511_10515 [Pedobacter suwonensis]|uniref:Uncharacterized protein n=1 Tax=Pedobacter suwonensis TaxID=332999 RepID=A0A1I0T0A6_9SPHI|nr:hypothetical protein SAMN04488511_10515 [Pedobacter suwonensis]
MKLIVKSDLLFSHSLETSVSMNFYYYHGSCLHEPSYFEITDLDLQPN